MPTNRVHLQNFYFKKRKIDTNEVWFFNTATGSRWLLCQILMTPCSVPQAMNWSLLPPNENPSLSISFVLVWNTWITFCFSKSQRWSSYRVNQDHNKHKLISDVEVGSTGIYHLLRGWRHKQLLILGSYMKFSMEFSY